LRFVAVPGREIDAKLQPVLARGVGHLADNVTLAVLPRTALYAVVGLLRRPQAKTVVMLRDQHNVARPGSFDRAHPLLRFEIGGIENLRIGGAVSPFAV